MEQRFGADFSGVTVHHDAAAVIAADRLRARAFTMGSAIFFGAGAWAPGTAEGRRTIAHELAHSRQSAAGPGAEPLSVGPQSSRAEAEADLAAYRVMAGERPPPSALSEPGVIHRQASGQQPRPAGRPVPGDALVTALLVDFRKRDPARFAEMLRGNEAYIRKLLGPYGYRGSWGKAEEYRADFDQAISARGDPGPAWQYMTPTALLPPPPPEPDIDILAVLPDGTA
jgi:Domain of unknown function (DUF4157)